MTHDLTVVDRFLNRVIDRSERLSEIRSGHCSLHTPHLSAGQRGPRGSMRLTRVLKIKYTTQSEYLTLAEEQSENSNARHTFSDHPVHAHSLPGYTAHGTILVQRHTGGCSACSASGVRGTLYTLISFAFGPFCFSFPHHAQRARAPFANPNALKYD